MEPGGTSWKDLAGWSIGETGGVRDDLGELPASDRASRAEVGVALGVTRLARPSASVASDNAPAGEAAHERVKGVGGGHIGELYGAGLRGGGRAAGGLRGQRCRRGGVGC